MNAKDQAVYDVVRRHNGLTMDQVFMWLPDHYRHGGRPALRRSLARLVKAGNLIKRPSPWSHSLSVYDPAPDGPIDWGKESTCYVRGFPQLLPEPQR